VDVKALAALQPDVVITQTRARPPDAGPATLERAVHEVLPSHPRLVALEPEALAQVEEDIRSVSAALDALSRGIQVVTRLRMRMQTVAARAADATGRPRVLFLEGLEPLTAAGSWRSELVAMAGGEDVGGSPGSAGPRLRWKDLAAADPDIIFVAPRGLPLVEGREVLASLASRRGWSRLRAVREGRVFLGDGDAHFDRRGPGVAEALEVLAEVLLPGAFHFGHEGTGWECWNGKR
jgi:iron complex transport system substrate-binding protein